MGRNGCVFEIHSANFHFLTALCILILGIQESKILNFDDEKIPAEVTVIVKCGAFGFNFKMKILAICDSSRSVGNESSPYVVSYKYKQSR